MRRLIGLACAIFLFSSLLPETSFIAGPVSAEAQQFGQRQGRPNLLELLFGGALRQQRLRNQPQQRNPDPNARRIILQRKPAGNQVRRQQDRQPAPKAVVQKAEDAKTILVIGDFMADGLHWGLQQAYSESPNVVFVDKSRGLSGLVRDDVIDWPAVTPDLIEEVDPIAVLVAVGMNDRQLMRTSAGRLDKLSEPWKAEYVARVERLAKAVRDKQLPLIWMGLPPVARGNMNSDYLVFNEIYRTQVEAAGGSFFDVWDGFTNAEGAFISAGPDINGQIVRLRNSDGINMTRAGKRKLAFYVEKGLRQATGITSGPVFADLPGTEGTAILASPEYDPASSGKTVVIALDSPQADGGGELEGAAGYLKVDDDEKSTSFDLVAKGTGFQPHEGRIDQDWGLPVEPPVEEPEKTEEEKADADPEKAASVEAAQ